MLDGLSLDGISILIGGFFFYCLAVPGRVKRERAYWTVFGILLLIVLFNTLRLMLYNSPPSQVITGICIGLLDAAGLVMTVIYAGGLSLRDVGEKLGDAAEQFRPNHLQSDSQEKTPIIPIAGEHPAPRVEPIVTPLPPRVSIELPKASNE